MAQTAEDLRQKFNSFNASRNNNSGFGGPKSAIPPPYQPIPQPISIPQISKVPQIQPPLSIAQIQAPSIPQINRPPTIPNSGSDGSIYNSTNSLQPTPQISVPQIQLPVIIAPPVIKSSQPQVAAPVPQIQIKIPEIPKIEQLKNDSTNNNINDSLEMKETKPAHIIVPPKINYVPQPNPEPKLLSEIKNENFTNTESSAKLPINEPIMPLVPEDIITPDISRGIKISETINKSIEKAKDGDIIIIPEGDYDESIAITKKIHLIGEGKVKISSKSGQDTLIIHSQNISISNITFIQNESQAARALTVSSGSVLFRNCEFSSKYMSSCSVSGKSSVKFEDCVIECENAPVLNLNQKSVAEFSKTTFRGSNSSGVILKGNSNAIFSDCIFEQIHQDGISITENCISIISGCKFTNIGENAVSISTESGKVNINSTNISDCHGSGICAFNNSSVSVSNCTISNCKTLVEVSDGAALFTRNNKYIDTNSDAMLVAFCHSKVRSENDTFSGNGNGVCSMERAAVELINTKIEKLNGCGAIVFGEHAVMNIQKATISQTKLAGIQAHTKATLSVKDSKIEKSNESGIYIENECKIMISNSSIIENGKSGIIINKSSAKLENIKAKQNAQCGLAILDSKNIEITKGSFSKNSGSGIVVKNSDNMSFDSTKVSKNNANGVEAHKSNVSLANIKSHLNKGCSLISNENSSLNVSNVDIVNSQIGLASVNSKISANNGTISECKVGVQSNSSEIDLNDISFNKNDLAFISVGSNNSKSEVKKCKFAENKNHIEARNDSTINVADCEFSKSNGISINANDNSNVNITTSKICGDEVCGIASNGNLKVENCSIEGSKQCGIYLYGGNSEIKANKIIKNGNIGIQAMSGNHAIIDNEISGHKSFGIHIDSDVSPSVSGNKFADNECGNVNRE